MRLFGFDITRAKQQQPKEERSCGGFGLTYQSASWRSESAMRLSAVYRCVDVISDAVAQLPCEPYLVDAQGYARRAVNHPAYWLLNREPNPQMTRFTLMKTMVVSMLLRGNAYALIMRDRRGNATELRYLPASEVTISVDGNGILQGYAYRGVQIPPRDMLHFLNFTYDGIHGVSTIHHAVNTLGLAGDSEAHARGFFQGGANLAGILTVQSQLSQQQAQEIKSAWLSAFAPGKGNPNSVAVLQGNMEFKPITVNPSDAQLLETRAFNVIDICRFFGVSPTKAFDFTHSSYSTVEATQLAFLTDTLSPMLQKIELEMERKLFTDAEKPRIDVRFDTAALLRADSSAQATKLNTLFNNGALSINEIRAQEGMEPIADGDTHFLQVNMQPLSAFTTKNENNNEQED